ncbi:MAG: hypothetical protein ACI4QN_07010 [Candidatus Coproplasma sp.]
MKSANLGLTVDLLTNSTDSENNVPAHLKAANENFKNIDEWASTVKIKPTTETYTITADKWTAVSDKSPFTHSATVTATTEIGEETLVELINNNAVAFANHGFAIAAVSGQSITIYSVGAPTSSVTLRIEIGG